MGFHIPFPHYPMCGAGMSIWILVLLGMVVCLVMVGHVVVILMIRMPTISLTILALMYLLLVIQAVFIATTLSPSVELVVAL